MERKAGGRFAWEADTLPAEPRNSRPNGSSPSPVDVAIDSVGALLFLLTLTLWLRAWRDRAPRRLVTLTGEVEIKRRRLRCSSCDVELVPLDAALGLEPRVQHTLGVKERGLWLVTRRRRRTDSPAICLLRRGGVTLPEPIRHGTGLPAQETG
jgi:hypothetical protein